VAPEQVARRTGGDQHAMVDDRQPRRQAFGFVHEMRRQQDGLAGSEQLPEAVPDEVACLRIESGGRLIQDQQLGIVDERACERQAALHSA
jgi:hypothetical protein